jgi:hypothetical protein
MSWVTEGTPTYGGRVRCILCGVYKEQMRTTVPNATRAPTEADIAWAAGFLEGEGHFRRAYGTRDQYGSENISAGQVNPEPLLKLQELFGGSVKVKSRGKWAMGDIFYWYVSGERARIVMRAVEPLMSARRREQIRKAFSR